MFLTAASSHLPPQAVTPNRPDHAPKGAATAPVATTFRSSAPNVPVTGPGQGPWAQGPVRTLWAPRPSALQEAQSGRSRDVGRRERAFVRKLDWVALTLQQLQAPTYPAPPTRAHLQVSHLAYLRREPSLLIEAQALLPLGANWAFHGAQAPRAQWLWQEGTQAFLANALNLAKARWWSAKVLMSDMAHPPEPYLWAIARGSRYTAQARAVALYHLCLARGESSGWLWRAAGQRELLGRALQLHPQCFLARFTLACHEMGTGSPDRAIATFNHAAFDMQAFTGASLQEVPVLTPPESFAGLGERQWRWLVDRWPDNLFFLETYATFALLNEHFNEAQQAWSKVLDSCPHSIPTLEHLGAFYERRGDWAQAEAAWNTALSFEPRLPRAHLAMGVLRAREADYAASEAHFEHFVGLFDDRMQAHLYIGEACRLAGFYGRALLAYAQILHRSPRHRDALLYGSLCLFNLGLYVEGLQLNLRIPTEPAEPYSAKIFLMRARLCAALNLKDETLEAFTQAIHHAPTSHKLFHEAAVTLARLGFDVTVWQS